jgi:hypothetical protein
MITMKYVFKVLLLALLLSACSPKESSGCPLPPSGFSESDLVGTWDGTKETSGDSIIIINGDGRYKQIMNIKRTGFQYESEWRPWRITYSEQGLPYLHLQGLLMCAYWDQIDCGTGETGIEPGGPAKDIYADTTYWYDFCQKKWITTSNEGVFMVFGGHKYKRDPRKIRLVPFTKSADTSTGSTYYLQESALPTSKPELLSTHAVDSTSELKSTPDVTHCISAGAWDSTAESNAAKAARDGICVEIGGERFVKHSIGTQISRGGSQGGVYVVWAPNPFGLVMVGQDWMAQVMGATELRLLKREGDQLYPENSTIPVLQDMGNDNYLALVNFYEQVLP